MARDETKVISLGKAKLKKELGKFLKSEKKIFDAKNIFIFCEGKTEYNYFIGFNKSHNNSRLKIIPRFPSDTLHEGKDIRELVEQVITSKQDERVIVKSNNKSVAFNIQPNDEFNIIFDADSNFIPNRIDESKYDEAIKLFNTGEIQLYLSNYSFEIWILCHFEKPPSGLMNNRHLRKRDILPNRIRRRGYIPDYDKRYKLIYEKLESKSKLDDAIKRADSLIGDKIRDGIAIHSIDSEPVTEVGLFIKELRKELI